MTARFEVSGELMADLQSTVIGAERRFAVDESAAANCPVQSDVFPRGKVA